MTTNISAGMVKDLREQTGAGMMECKKALMEAEGDMDRAKEIINKAGHRKADKKADRTAAEGVISGKCSADGKQAVLVEVNCETDFVARDTNFKTFCEEISNIALAQQAKSIEALKELKMNDGLTVEEGRRELINKIGENINIRRLEFYHSENGHIGYYTHSGKIGVLVDMEGGDTQLAKDVAMHIAASSPKCISADEVSPEIIERETRLFTEKAIESGKPKEIAEKMVAGQIKKFTSEICLHGQPFVKDMDQTVEKVLQAKKAKINAFCRYEVGEGIEVQKLSFQEEVMSTARGK